MTISVERKSVLYKIISLLLPLVLVCGTRSYLKISIAGVFLTPYRLLIPLIFLFLTIDNYSYVKLKTKECFKDKSSDRCFFLFFVMLGIWLLYGSISLVVSEYSVTSIGIKELVVLFISGLTVFNVVVLCDHGYWNWILIGLRITVVLSLAVSLLEIVTGIHLSTSRYSDPEFLQRVYGIVGDSAGRISIGKATGFFYNENDNMAFLVILSPLFASDIQEKTIIKKSLGCLFLGMIFFIIYINDAFICLIACLISLAVFLILSWPNILSMFLTIGTLVITRVITSSFANNQLESAVFDQIENLEGGYGSMYYRFNTYLVTLRETFSVTKGLGFGAGSYTNYFQNIAQSERILSSPHCFWLEILSEYGLFIFLLFVVFLVVLYIRLITDVRNKEPFKGNLVLGMGTALVFASVAPSGFLQQTYYWVAIALAIYLIDSAVSNGKAKKKNIKIIKNVDA